MNFKIIFHTDGRGVYFDSYNPTHLDDILHAVFIRLNGLTRDLQRDETPDETGLPLCQTVVDGRKLFNASALIPDGPQFESLHYFRKKYPLDRIDLTDATSVNLQNGVYREYNVPYPLLHCPRLVAYASGNRKEVKRTLKKHLCGIGKFRAIGHGRIVDITCEETPEDWSLVKDGVAMRWLPDEKGLRKVRTQPPYWNNTNRVACCEVGDPYEL